MNKSTLSPEETLAEPSREELMAALFAHMVMQQANMALMLLGKVAHPATGEFVRDMEGAKLFIDQLEMLEAKTKGNLSKEEEDLLKQNLMALRMAFVETVESPEAQKQPRAEHRATATPTGESGQAAAAGKKVEPSVAPSSGGEEEGHKKFSKKY